jgi:hypothetical protein
LAGQSSSRWQTQTPPLQGWHDPITHELPAAQLALTVQACAEEPPPAASALAPDPPSPSPLPVDALESGDVPPSGDEPEEDPDVMVELESVDAPESVFASAPSAGPTAPPSPVPCPPPSYVAMDRGAPSGALHQFIPGSPQ